MDFETFLLLQTQRVREIKCSGGGVVGWKRGCPLPTDLPVDLLNNEDPETAWRRAGVWVNGKRVKDPDMVDDEIWRRWRRFLSRRIYGVVK